MKPPTCDTCGADKITVGIGWACPKCHRCGGTAHIGAYIKTCPTCEPRSKLPCAWCGVQFTYCKCDGASSPEAADERKRDPDWSKTYQGAA